MANHRWQSYQYVRAYVLSIDRDFEHRARVQMQRAAMEKAPLTAVCPDRGDPGHWVTMEDLTDDDRMTVEVKMKELYG